MSYSKTRRVLLLKFQTQWYSSLMVCIFEKHKLEILKISEPKLGKFISKLKLKLEIFMFLKLNNCSNLKFSSSIKLEFDEMSDRSKRNFGNVLTLWLILWRISRLRQFFQFLNWICFLWNLKVKMINKTDLRLHSKSNTCRGRRKNWKLRA